MFFDAGALPGYNVAMVADCHMIYREPLPANCPPDDAEEITARCRVYRLVRHNPPVADDFRSQRAAKPHLILHNVTECQARGLSVFTARNDAGRRTRAPRLQGTMVCEVLLDQGAGRIQQTGRGSHHTWWPWADFDILANCTVPVG